MVVDLRPAKCRQRVVDAGVVPDPADRAVTDNCGLIMSSNPPRIGIFGTFDLQNWGDLLFPLLARRALTQRLGVVEVIPFSYRSKTAADWYYEVQSIGGSTPVAISDLDAVLVGGGHLIRFDKEIAPGYLPVYPRVHHPTGYWLIPTLLGAAAGVPVIWNAPSASSDLPKWAATILGLALRATRYIAVRDAASRNELLRFAPECVVEIVPDTAFGVADVVDLDTPSSELEELIELNGIQRPYILLQASDRAVEFTAPILAARDALAGHQFVEIAVGPALGDQVGNYDCWGLADHVQISDWPTPTCLAELVAGSSGVIGTSLHLSIGALAFGHPVLLPCERAYSKYAPLEEHDTVSAMVRSDSAAGEKFARQVTAGARSPALFSVLEKVAAHWNRVAEVVRGGRLEPAPLGSSDFLMDLPFHLESAAATED